MGGGGSEEADREKEKGNVEYKRGNYRYLRNSKIGNIKFNIFKEFLNTNI